MRILLAAAATALAMVPTAQADTYIGLYGGWNQSDVISVPFVDRQAGHVVGGVFGTTTGIPGLRFEADLSFRQNEVDILGGFLNADHDTTALMGNMVYDLPFGIGPITPYVLAGVGYANTKATFEDVALLRLEASGVAWQVGGGLTTSISGVTVGIGYRMLQAPELDPLAGFGLPELSDGTNHSVVAEMRFAL